MINLPDKNGKIEMKQYKYEIRADNQLYNAMDLRATPIRSIEEQMSKYFLDGLKKEKQQMSKYFLDELKEFIDKNITCKEKTNPAKAKAIKTLLEVVRAMEKTIGTNTQGIMTIDEIKSGLQGPLHEVLQTSLAAQKKTLGGMLHVTHSDTASVIMILARKFDIAGVEPPKNSAKNDHHKSKNTCLESTKSDISEQQPVRFSRSQR